MQKAKQESKLRQKKDKTTIKNRHLEFRYTFSRRCVYGACDFGLRTLILTPSTARLTRSLICCDVKVDSQTSRSNNEEKQRGTERYNPSLKIGEYFAGSLVFLCSFAGSDRSDSAPASCEPEGAEPKSGSNGKLDPKPGVVANVIGDWTVISVFCSGSNANGAARTGGPELNPEE